MFTINKLSKNYGSTKILSDVELQLESSDIGILNGGSGTGKSTLLQCISGLIPYDSGYISIDDSQVISGTCHPDISIVFQSYELFPHYNAISNVMLPLVLVKKMDKLEAQKKAENLLSIMGLQDKAQSSISSLSGGQLQRLAIARACVMSPRLLLLDEPSAALDRENTSILVDILQSLRENEMMVLIATHDLDFIEKLQEKESSKGKVLFWN
jgi:polar amino acid transport system ATP-binding protein